VTDTGQGQAGDTNLGYKTFLNGTLVSNIVLDTSNVATDTIDYVATDTDGAPLFLLYWLPPDERSSRRGYEFAPTDADCHLLPPQIGSRALECGDDRTPQHWGLAPFFCAANGRYRP
jgi:hypothetical protein